MFNYSFSLRCPSISQTFDFLKENVVEGANQVAKFTRLGSLYDSSTVEKINYTAKLFKEVVFNAESARALAITGFCAIVSRVPQDPLPDQDLKIEVVSNALTYLIPIVYYSISFFNKISENKIQETVHAITNGNTNQIDNRPKMLIVETNKDDNNAFEIKKKECDLFVNLNKNYSLERTILTETIDVNRAIDKKFAENSPAKILMMRMHGYHDSMTPTAKETIASYLSEWEIGSSSFDVGGIHFSKLDPNATIILDSCLTGKQSNTEPCIAEFVQFYAGPNRKVVAPTTATTSSSLRLNEKGEFRFVLLNGQDVTSPITYESSVKKIKAFTELRYEQAKQRLEQAQNLHERVQDTLEAYESVVNNGIKHNES